MKCFTITDETSTTTYRVRAGKKPSAALRHVLDELVNLAKREMDREQTSTRELMLAALNAGLCGHCGSERLQRGPEGGLTENVKCAGCGSIFNYCPPCAVMPAGFVERVK